EEGAEHAILEGGVLIQGAGMAVQHDPQGSARRHCAESDEAQGAQCGTTWDGSRHGLLRTRPRYREESKRTSSEQQLSLMSGGRRGVEAADLAYPLLNSRTTIAARLAEPQLETTMRQPITLLAACLALAACWQPTAPGPSMAASGQPPASSYNFVRLAAPTASTSWWRAMGINDSNWVIGWASLRPDETCTCHAILWHDSVTIDLGTLPGGDYFSMP